MEKHVDVEKLLGPIFSFSSLSLHSHLSCQVEEQMELGQFPISVFFFLDRHGPVSLSSNPQKENKEVFFFFLGGLLSGRFVSLQ